MKMTDSLLEDFMKECESRDFEHQRALKIVYNKPKAIEIK
jgi:hypothetical protein